MLGDKKLSTKLKAKIYIIAIRPVLMYNIDEMALRKEVESQREQRKEC